MALVPEVDSLCGAAHWRGVLCNRPAGHDGAHSHSDTNGILAWGFPLGPVA